MVQLAKLKPNIGCFSLHPGVVNTNLPNVWAANSWPVFFAKPFLPIFLKTPKDGAQTSIYCAVSEELEKAEMSGKYFSDSAVAETKFVNEEMAEKLWEISESITSSKLA